MEYATFQGEIPAGEYGGGTVTVWDHGRFTLDEWTDRQVSVTFEGERTSGRFVLFRTGGDRWMIHRKDPPPEGWHPMPARFSPMLATPGPLPDGPEWAYEFKWDGIRAGVAVEGGRVSIRSRGGGDLTTSFPELRGLGEALGSTAVLFDGELVVLDTDGRPDFGLIQQRLRVDDPRRAGRLAKRWPADLVIFDLLYIDGEPLVDLPYRERRRRLESLGPQGPHWAVAPSFTDVTGDEVMRAARRAGIEGVVSKRLDSRYRPGGRGSEWVKTKLVRSQEVLIGGFTAGHGSRRDTFGALLLGVPGGDGLEYVGRVGTGFTRADREELVRLLRPLVRKTSPFAASVPTDPGVVWTRPSLVAEVQFSDWTGDGHLRHPSWRGLRRDKSPDEVVRE
jgi:bifunctional non-homologous end joining protein LigD